MMKATRCVLATTAIAPLVALASCSTTPVDADPAGRASTSACAKASRSWPRKVADLKPYPVTSSSETVRAWGSDTDNAIIARCGVDSPGPTTDACIQVDDIDWVQSQVKGGYRFVTYGREPGIEVLIPKAASNTPGMLLPAFTPVARAIPQGSHRCQ